MSLRLNFYVNYFFFFLIFFFKLTIANSPLLDLFIKVKENNNFFNNYSLFWVNFWYVTIFFLFFLIFLLFFFNFYYNFFFPQLLILIFFYYFEIFNFYISNCRLYFLNSKLHGVNLLLINNFNNYHPFLFYFCFVLFMFTILYNIMLVSDYFYFKKECLLLKRLITIFLFFSTTIAMLAMGSWWAAQESSWGGWWNWDASETLGLFFLILIFFFIHFSLKLHNYFNYFFFTYMYLIVFLVAYSLIQLNFTTVSHNFGIKFFYFFKNNWFIVEFILLVVFIFCKLFIFVSMFSYSLWFSPNVTNFNIKFLYKNFFLLVFFLLLVIVLLLSFGNLFNYFYFNSRNNQNELNLLFLLSLIAFFNTINFIGVWFLIIFFFSLFFVFRISINLFKKMHFFLISFFFLNILLMNSESVLWSINSFGNVRVENHYLMFFYAKYSLNSLNYEPQITIFSFFNWIAEWLFNNANFFLWFNNLHLINIFHINVHWNFYFLRANDFFFVNSFILLSVIPLLIVFYFNKIFFLK